MSVIWREGITDLSQKVSVASQRQPSYSGAALERDLDRVRAAWVRFQTTRKRSAIYPYLTAVFDLVTVWVAEGKARSRARRALQFQSGEGRMMLEPFSVVLFVTMNGKASDKKSRSKWARVLRYAAEVKRASETLEHFITRKGGINACAALYARRLRRQRKK